MKTTIFKLVTIMLIATGSFVSCEEKETPVNGHENGITPTSIEQIIDVFELKYGEVKECIYDGKTFKFYITDIVDSLISCKDYKYISESWNVKIHTYLRIGYNHEDKIFKVSSSPCAGDSYDDSANASDVHNLLNEWQELQTEQNNSLFQSRFSLNYGFGTKIEDTPYSIFIANAYAYMHHHQKNKNSYKFIFIITNQKSI